MPEFWLSRQSSWDSSGVSKVWLVMLIEAGTHIVDALMCPYGERVRAKNWRSVRPGMLLMWDRDCIHVMVESTQNKDVDYLVECQPMLNSQWKKI